MVLLCIDLTGSYRIKAIQKVYSWYKCLALEQFTPSPLPLLLTSGCLRVQTTTSSISLFCLIAMSDHPRMMLNNWLQGRYGTTRYLSWDAAQIGPQHAGYWMVTAYFNNIEYGRGTGITRGAAADRAAEQVLIALRGY